MSIVAGMKVIEAATGTIWTVRRVDILGGWAIESADRPGEHVFVSRSRQYLYSLA